MYFYEVLIIFWVAVINHMATPVLGRKEENKSTRFLSFVVCIFNTSFGKKDSDQWQK